METRQVPGLKGKGKTFTRGDGYYFNANNGVYVKCAECNLRGKLVEGELVINAGDHTNLPDPQGSITIDIHNIKIT